MELYFKEYITTYMNDDNGRYKSYDHIRNAFIKYRKNKSKKDLLTLFLYNYLASWGMLRNSFLMQKDYKFSLGVINILCEEKYDSVLDYNPFNDEDYLMVDLIKEIGDRIKNYYLHKTYYDERSKKLKEIKNVSDTLITKILLGTFGCCVAYDTYVRKSLRFHGIIQSFGKKSLIQIRDFAKENKSLIEADMVKLNKTTKNLYTPFKILDMYFFEKGLSLKD